MKCTEVRTSTYESWRRGRHNSVPITLHRKQPELGVQNKGPRVSPPKLDPDSPRATHVTSAVTPSVFYVVVIVKRATCKAPQLCPTQRWLLLGLLVYTKNSLCRKVPGHGIPKAKGTHFQFF